MNNINPDLLKKFLAGNASDEEIQRCEVFLNNDKNSQLLDDLDHDSLVDTLRNFDASSTVTQVDDLVQRIQQIVPRKPIGPDELNRVLSPAESDDELGRIGRYGVIEFIASGGMGLVFKAEDLELERLVCIKVLHPLQATNADAKSRFAREAKASAKLRHDRIITVLEVGEHRELPYLVMQLLDGESLRDKIAKTGRFDPSDAKKLITQIAEGLHYAHGLGYLHRDIKPENIWVTTDGDIKLLDFGLARFIDQSNNLTGSGTILGTPSYMSPEQVQGLELDARSDLFSVGTVFFEMLTGESPFGKSNMFSTMMSVANDSVQFPPSSAVNAVPLSLQPIVAELLQKKPADRTESAQVLIEKLRSLSETKVERRTNARGNDGGRWKGWTIAAAAGAACVAFALLLMQLTDRGTLVVEADPSVNVTIANQQVVVHDPQTERKFTISIGDHPLPSGVYQLELLDASGDYQLSSNVISIRRGDQQIVRVELKPVSVAVVGDQPTPIAERNSVPLTNDTNEPTQGSRVAVAELPTLNAKELRRKLNISRGDALFPNAVVSQPRDRDEVVSWSIEPAYRASKYEHRWRPNADGTRIATSCKGELTVRVWNRAGELLLMIPAQDDVAQVCWSPDRNILAILENGKLRQQLTVWKLFDDHAELIDVIPTEAQRVAWSWDGRLMALENKNDVTFVDLSRGSMFAHPNFGITGSVSEHPWSADGRFFATTEEGNVKVWDMQEKKLFHIFNSSSEGRFLPDRNELVLQQEPNKKWEIWDLDSFERRSVYEANPEWFSCWPNHRFTQVAAISKDGMLTVQEVATGKTWTSRLWKDEEDHQNFAGYTEPDWSADDQMISTEATLQVFLKQTPDRNRALDQVEYEPISLKPLAAEYVPFDQFQRVSSPATADAKQIVFHKPAYLEPSGFKRFDLESLSESPETESPVVGDSLIYATSPDGKSVAFVGTDVSPRPESTEGMTAEERSAAQAHWASDLQMVRVCSLETGKLLREQKFDSQVFGLLWLPDSESLVVSKRNSVTEDPANLIPESAVKYAAGLLKQYDQNKDGQLDAKEMKQMRRPPNEIADENSDGLFTAEELVKSLVPKPELLNLPSGFNSYLELQPAILNVESGALTPLELDSETT